MELNVWSIDNNKTKSGKRQTDRYLLFKKKE